MRARIFFSHGNSFPGGTYRLMLDNLRQRGFEVQAIDRYGHDPKYPVTNNWPHLLEQLADQARAWQQEALEAGEAHGERVAGVGDGGHQEASGSGGATCRSYSAPALVRSASAK